MDHSPPPAPHATELRHVIHRPSTEAVPLVLASAHSGHDYRADFLAAARLSPQALRRSEDSFVDELFQGALTLGAPMLTATFPRAFCDPNREAWELDPDMFDGPLPGWVNTTSARVSAGLGTVARIVATGEPIYRGKLSFADVEDRIQGCWMPYHAALVSLIAESRNRFGHCVLIDCHSMPSAGPAAAKPDGACPAPHIVLGDAFGTSCAPGIVQHVETAFQSLGYRVRRNDPYAGGYVTRHYGRPREHVHALQIELSRDLYMNEARYTRGPGFGRVQSDLTKLIASLCQVLPALITG